MKEWTYTEDRRGPQTPRRRGDRAADVPVRRRARLTVRRVLRATAQALAFSGLVVLIPAALGFLSSDHFRLTDVVVKADDVGLAREVAAALAEFKPLQSTSALFPPMRDIRRCAETRPRVLQAAAYRKLPRGLIVEVEERLPRFAVATPQGFMWSDAEGVLLLPVRKPGPEFPRVTLAPSLPLATGARIPPRDVDAVLACLDGAKQAGIAPSFLLDISTPMRYTLNTPAATPIWLGGGDNLQYKIIAAAGIEKHWAAKGRKLQYIDVRVVTSYPAYKLQG